MKHKSNQATPMYAASKSTMTRRLIPLLGLLGILCGGAASATPQTAAEAAAPVQPPAHGEKIPLPGIKNAGKISPALYRGAQPHEQSLAQLKKLGITTLVDLRGEDATRREREKKEAESLGIRFVSIPVSGWSPPTNEQVAQFLSLFRGSSPGKVFVHCRFGDDRTGVFVATYRMAVEKWAPEQALKEMYYFGFNGFWHPAMIHFVREFPTRLNTAAVLAPFGGAERVESPR